MSTDQSTPQSKTAVEATTSYFSAETGKGRGCFRRCEVRLGAAMGLLLALGGGVRAQQVSLSAAVDAVSSPGAAQQIVPGNTSGDSVYEVFSTPTITGSAARLFGVQNGTNTCTGTIAGGGVCSVYVLFEPTFGTTGQVFSATLNLPFELCQTPIASGNPTGPANCQSTGATFSLAGTVTGAATGVSIAQIQITPTQPVLLQPGNYGSELAKDNNGGLLASINNTVVQFSAQQAYTPNATPTVIAGNGGSGGTGDGQPALQAGIDPYGIADIGGTVYVVDTGQGVVRDFYAGGQMNLFLGQYGLHCYTQYSTNSNVAPPDGCYGDYAIKTPSELDLAGPSSLATDGANLYVNDYNVSYFGYNTTANYGSNTIAMYSATSNITTTLAGYAGEPYLDNGDLTFTVYPGYSGDGGPANQAEINGPGGMAVDASSNLYFADTGNNVIRKVDISNTISTYLGQGPGVSGSYPVGLGNGLAAQATLSNPLALTFDPLGNMYIFDQSGYALREVQINNGNPISINTLYSLSSSVYPPPAPFDTGTPVMDTTGEILVSPYSNLATYGFSYPRPTPGIYELLGSGLLTFPAVEIGTPESLTATITNPGTAGLEILGESISGTNGADFSISPTSTCGSSVGSGGSCTIIVTYNPTSQYTALTRTATLYLTTNVGSGTQVIALTGTTYTQLKLTKGTTYTPYYNWPETSTAVAYVTASGGVAPYTFADNISSASGDWYFNSGTTTATIAGSPLVVGTVPYSITVTDSLGSQATYSGSITATTAPSSVYIAASQSSTTSGTTAVLTGAVNPGETLAPGAVLPSGYMQIQQDGGSYMPYQLSSAAAIQPLTFSFDILYHSITATYNGDANYAATNFPQTLTFNGNLPQTITFPGSGLSAPVGSKVALTAYASSGLQVTYTVVSGPGNIYSSGTDLVLYSTGTVQVKATQAGNNSFAPATTATASFTSY